MKSFRRLQARDILCGALLGDGSLSTQRNTTPTCHMHIGHCDAQKEYLKYKIKLLESCVPTTFKITSVMDKRNNTWYNHGISKKNKYFWKLRQIFYSTLNVGAKRKMPKEFIERYFDIFALMILFLDDGHLDFNPSGLFRQMDIYTMSYTLDENEFLKDFINKKFNLEFSVKMRKVSGEKRYFLNLTTHDKVEKFVNLIKGGVPECMNYKIYFDCRPVNSKASLRHLNSDEHGEYIVRYISKKN